MSGGRKADSVDMAEGLQKASSRAKQNAQLLLTFQDYLPPSAEAPITNVVTELFGVSRALLDLRKSIEDPRNQNYLDDIRRESDTIGRSLVHTLSDLSKQTNAIEEFRERGLERSSKAKEVYPFVWSRLGRHFSEEGAKVQGCESLSARLDTYIRFLKCLKAILDGDSPSRDFKDIRYWLEKLLENQERNFEEGFELGRLSLEPGTPKFEKQKSWERKRPPREGPSRDRPNRVEARTPFKDRGYERSRDRRPYKGDDRRPEKKKDSAWDDKRAPKQEKKRYDRLGNKWDDRRKHSDSDYDRADLANSTSTESEFEDLGSPIDFEYPDDDSIGMPEILTAPQLPTPRSKAGAGGSPFSPMRPGGPSSMGYFAPVAPEPPRIAVAGFASPVGGAATPSTLSSEAGGSMADSHWLPMAFGLSRPSTQFKRTGSESACFGDHDPSVVNPLRDQYDQILKLPVEEHLELRIFIRDGDSRAKILVRQDRGRGKVLACEAVASLRILRHESCLQLCQSANAERKNGGRAKVDRSKVFLWTQLRFTTYERMVIFWCSFQALKIQDEYEQLQHLEDASLNGEECLFAGYIDDDSYKHALHILRDKDSGGVRLQASVLSGWAKRCPVWTAFITYSLSSRTWARRSESKKVHLQELSRYIFTEQYEPQLGPQGEHEIKFVRATDAKNFYQTLDDIAEHRI